MIISHIWRFLFVFHDLVVTLVHVCSLSLSCRCDYRCLGATGGYVILVRLFGFCGCGIYLSLGDSYEQNLFD